MTDKNTIKNLMIAKAQQKGGEPIRHLGSWDKCFVEEDGLLRLEFEKKVYYHDMICYPLTDEAKETYDGIFTEEI